MYDMSTPPPIPECQRQVVDNPRLGLTHTLRALTLHGLVLFGAFRMAMLGWEEFYRWGEGPVGQVLLSPFSASSGGGDGGGDGEGYLSTDPQRGGAGFALLLLYPLSLTVVEVWLSALKYLANLLELRKEEKNVVSQADENVLETPPVAVAVSRGDRFLLLSRNAVSQTKVCWRPLRWLVSRGDGVRFGIATRSVSGKYILQTPAAICLRRGYVSSTDQSCLYLEKLPPSLGSPPRVFAERPRVGHGLFPEPTRPPLLQAARVGLSTNVC